MTQDFDNLDEWSNGAIDAVEAGNLEVAERLSKNLLRVFPEMIDWYECLA